MDHNRQTAKPPNRRTRRSRSGFTLIEAALTTVIVGTGVLAIVAAQQAYHQKNDWAQRTGTAFLLANELRELMLPLPLHDPQQPSHYGLESNEVAGNYTTYDDVDDFAGTVVGGVGAGLTINPPINALGLPLDDMAQWTQHVEVVGVLPSNLNVASANAYQIGSTQMLR